MFATVRHYVGLSDATIDALIDRANDITGLLLGVPGCADGLFIRTRDGLVVVLTGDNEAAVVEASRRYVAWARRNVPTVPAGALATVWAGEALLTVRAGTGKHPAGDEPSASRP